MKPIFLSWLGDFRGFKGDKILYDGTIITSQLIAITVIPFMPAVVHVEQIQMYPN